MGPGRVRPGRSRGRLRFQAGFAVRFPFSVALVPPLGLGFVAQDSVGGVRAVHGCDFVSSRRLASGVAIPVVVVWAQGLPAACGELLGDEMVRDPGGVGVPARGRSGDEVSAVDEDDGICGWFERPQ